MSQHQHQELSNLPPRIGHSCLFHSGNNMNNEHSSNLKVYMFGGSLSDRKTFPDHDLLEINENQEWNHVDSSRKDSSSPSGLIHHCACNYYLNNKLENRDEMIVFGGKNRKKELENKVWSYNFNGKQWKCLHEGDKMVKPRFGHSGVVFGNNLFVFGGMDDKKKCRNELFAFNLERRQWKLIEMSVSISERVHHASVLDEENGDWYLFGGQSGKNVLNDFVRIKLSTYDESSSKCESEILMANLSEEFSRFGHSLVLEKLETGLKFYSIGGCNMKKDFLDCISLELSNLSNGWKIETEHSLSKTFANFSQDVGPVFHSTTPINITKGNDNIVSYFVFGGLYEHTKVPSPKKTASKKETPQKELISKFDIINFENKLNDDIFKVILSFMTIPDLLKLHLTSKKLRICTITTDDEIWKGYYQDRIKWLKEASMTSKSELNPQSGTYETVEVQSTVYDSYQEFNCDYKKHLIELIGDLMKEADKNRIERVNFIKILPDSRNIFRTRDEIMKHELDSKVKTDIKVVLVGSAGIGKTCLYQSLMDAPFSNEYTPTVFDNYTVQCHSEDLTFNLALWDTAGQNDFDRLRPLSYPQTDIFLIGFSCLSEFSMKETINKWEKEIRTYTIYPNIPIILVNTKIDLRDDPVESRKLLVTQFKKPISYQEGELLAQKLGCATYLETSAKKIGLEGLCEVIIKTVNICNNNGKKREKKKKCPVQ